MIAKIDQLTVRPVTEQDLQRLANLVHFETHIHRHLDWRAPLDWVGHEPYLVIEHGEELLAALACPPDPPGIAWIRLFAVSSEFSIATAWDELWEAVREHLFNQEQPVEVAAIPLHVWFRKLLEKSSFVRTNLVIVLSWKRASMPPASDVSERVIRPMELADIEAVESVDKTAFGLVWQNSLQSLEIAFRQAAVATVAEFKGAIIGYSISTATPIGGHLARLAVKPEYQGKGTGYALLHDLLMQFQRRGAQNVTVNTQEDNLSSLALYRKAGFHRTSEEYPVYQFVADKALR